MGWRGIILPVCKSKNQKIIYEIFSGHSAAGRWRKEKGENF